MSAKPMILDERMPVYDAAIAEHRLVAADPVTTWRASRELDFLTVHTPLMDAAMWVRGLPDRLRGVRRGRPAELRLAGGAGLPGWLVLGESEGEEVAFGAVGQFWQSRISWHEVPLAQFADFAESGYGKIACNFTVRPYGEGRTLLSYECRTAITDPVSRRRFGRYWLVVRPFVGHIMRAAMAAIAADAEHQAARPSPRPSSRRPLATAKTGGTRPSA